VGAESSGHERELKRQLGDELDDIQSDSLGLIGGMEEGLLRRVVVSGGPH
jgi:hypothetical protein